jgi:hypothetical protein
MLLYSLCYFLKGIEVGVIPALFVFCVVAFLWASLQYITMGDYDMYHNQRAKALFIWCTGFFALSMVAYALVLMVLSFIGVTNAVCGL